MRFERLWLRLLVTVFILGLRPCAAQGVIRTWDNEGTTDSWDENLNWSGNLRPGKIDDAVVHTGSPLVNTLENVRSLDNSVTIRVQGSLVINTGPLHNSGQILIDNGPTPGNANLAIGAGTLDGPGEIVLADSDFANMGAELNGGTFPSFDMTTHATGHTIRGEGTIGGNWLNQGTIRAEETSSDMMALLKLTAGDFLNEALITSSATGALLLTGPNIIGGAGGHFVADHVPVYIDSGAFTGGVLDSANGGAYEMLPSSGVLLNGATITGLFHAEPTSGSTTISSATGGFTNNGVMTFNSAAGSNFARLSSNDPLTVSGSGEMIFRREEFTGTSGFTTITNGAGHTMRGVGLFTSQFMINNGSIIAEPQTGGTVLRISAQMTNNSLLQASSGAVLLIRNAVTQDNATGRIRAANGGFVVIDGASVTGGKLQSEGTGAIDISAAAPTFDNLTNEGTVNVRTGRFLNISPGTLTNNGQINVNSDNLSFITTLEFDGNTTIAGTGTITLNRPGANGAVLKTNGDDVVLTQAAGHTIRGSGQLNAVLVNHGRLEGNSAAAPLEINNAVVGNGVLEDVRIDGVLVAGDVGAPAIVPLEGSYVQSNSAQLWIDLGGTTPGTGYDQLNSTGSITLNPSARLDVFVISGFVPAGGNQFTIATTTGSRSGTFGTVMLPANIPNYALIWKPVTYTANSVILEVLSVISLSGDYNANGVVDAADYTVWRDTLGLTGAGLAADGNHNNQIEAGDYDVWKASFGNHSGSGASANTAVPEPTTVLMLVIAFLTACTCRRQTCRKLVRP